MVGVTSARLSAITCSICGGTAFSEAGRRVDKVRVLRCETCGMGRTEAIPQDLLSFYDDTYYSSQSDAAMGYRDYGFTADHGVSWAAALVRLLRGDGRVLDVGCADGLLLRKLGDSYERYGIEVNRGMAEIASAAGIKVIAGDIYDPGVRRAFCGYFDVVTAIAVFEHVADFGRAAEIALALLAEGGVLLFEVPLMSVRHDNSVWLRSSLEHVYYPTEQSLRHLFERRLGARLRGLELGIKDYGATYVGLVTRDAALAARLGALLNRLTQPPAPRLSREEALAGFLLQLVHAAHSEPEIVGSLARLSVDEMTPAMLARLAQLWERDVRRGLAVQHRLTEVSAALRTAEEERARQGGTINRLRGEAETAAAAERRQWEAKYSELLKQLTDERARQAVIINRLRGEAEAAAAAERRQWEVKHADLLDQLTEERARQVAIVDRLRGEAEAAVAAERRQWEARHAELLQQLNEERAGHAVTIDRLQGEAEAAVAAERRRGEAEHAALLERWSEQRGHQAVTINRLRGEAEAAVAAERHQWEARHSELLEQLSDARTRLHLEAIERRHMADEKARTDQEMAALLASRSWRMTAPLRRIVSRWRDRRPARTSAPPDHGPGPAVLRAVSPEARDQLRSQSLQPSATGDVQLYAVEEWPADRPLVSVVVPCFNYGMFVAEAVDSVLAQTCQDLEVIVVDGGSTDPATKDVLAAFARPKTRVLRRDEPRRVGDNRNFGIAQARGKYVCCLDADDRLRPTYLEKAVFLLENYGYDLVSTSVRRFGLENDTYGVEPYPDLADMLWGNHVATCAVFRRALWEAAGGYRDCDPYLYEDWQLWVRLAALGARIANIWREHLFEYRRHDHGSLSSHLGILSREKQAGAIREANADVVTDDAIERSRRARDLRLRATNGLTNLRRAAPTAMPGRTILLALPFICLGGAERLLSGIARHLAEVGYRIIIVSTVDPAPGQPDMSPWFEPATAEIYHLPRFLEAGRWVDFIEYLVECKGVDLLWIAGSAFIYELLPALRRRHPGLRVVDLLFNTVGHTASNRRYASLIDVTFVENHEVGAWLKDAGEQDHRIRRIPSGVDLDYWSPREKPADLLQALEFARDQFIVGFAGRFSEEKAPLAFVDIAAETDPEAPIGFIMMGAGPLEQATRAHAGQYPLERRLKIVGAVPEVRDHLACCDVVVLCSTLDGRPNIVMEAAAMGIPVVASRVGGLPELVLAGETGFLCSAGDVKAFARRIEELRHRPELHSRMRSAARTYAESEFDARRMRSDYEQALAELMRRCGPAAVAADERAA
jgi:glycosyltransferase involved in cell wall biosynthesis/SAM-dependent methyltransferase